MSNTISVLSYLKVFFSYKKPKMTLYVTKFVSCVSHCISSFVLNKGMTRRCRHEFSLQNVSLFSLRKFRIP